MTRGEAKQQCANCGHMVVEFWSVQNEWKEFTNFHVPTTKHGGVVKVEGQRYEVIPKVIGSRVTYNCRCAQCGITEIDIDISRFYGGV